jgi:hypothetical protein
LAKAGFVVSAASISSIDRPFVSMPRTMNAAAEIFRY